MALLVALDSPADDGSVAIAWDGAELALRAGVGPGRPAELLLAWLGQAMDEAGFVPAQVDAVAVAVGPDAFTRTVRSTLAAPAQWQVTASDPPGFEVTVAPATFTVAPGATQVLTITTTGSNGAQPNPVAFGDFVMATVTPGQSPDLRVTVSLRGDLDGVFKHGFELL